MALTVPTDELPPGMESTSHVTVVTEFPVTVAVKAWLCPVVSAALTGLMDTEAVPPEEEPIMVTVAEADFVVSAADAAVTVTVAGDGTAAGAV